MTQIMECDTDIKQIKKSYSINVSQTTAYFTSLQYNSTVYF